MIYLRSLVVGVLTCLLWLLLLYLMTEGEIVNFANGDTVSMKVFIYVSFISATLSNWVFDVYMPRDPKTYLIVGVSWWSILMRMGIALFTVVMFSIILASMDGNPLELTRVLFTFTTSTLMLAAYASCQLLHRLGPTYLLKR